MNFTIFGSVSHVSQSVSLTTRETRLHNIPQTKEQYYGRIVFEKENEILPKEIAGWEKLWFTGGRGTWWKCFCLLQKIECDFKFDWSWKVISLLQRVETDEWWPAVICGENVVIRVASMSAVCPGLIGGYRSLCSLVASNQQCCELDMSSHGQPSEGVWETMMWEKSGRLTIETAVFLGHM